VLKTVAVAVRTIGVEEELMLVDPETGQLSQSSHEAIRADRRAEAAPPASPSDGEKIETELYQSQIETNSQPCETLADLRESLVRGRREAMSAAVAAGCEIAAVATPVLGFARDVQRPASKPRYHQIVDEYADMTVIVSGMHVHVAASDDEAVAVIDRLRPWIPLLLAMSANSPFNAGRDTGHASWRSQLWGRWSTAGPVEPFGDLEGYRRATQAVIDTGAALDRGMLYLDARPSASFPTVEVRVADVCTELDDAVLIAALTRALVATAAAEAADGGPVDDWRTDLLRAARWRASRFGMSRDLVHPVTRTLARPREVVAALVDHTADALDETGDRAEVEDLLERLFARGTGATRQRAVAEAAGSLKAVVDDLRERTRASFA
jgi:carboxylate-amine ligase